MCESTEVDPIDETRSGLRFHVSLFSSPRDPYPRSRAAAALEGALILYRLFNTACEQLPVNRWAISPASTSSRGTPPLASGSLATGADARGSRT